MMLVTHWSVTHARGMSGYRWEMTCDGVTYQAVSGDVLGSIMSAFREQMRLIAEDHGQYIQREERELTGPILVERWTVERLTTQVGYRLWMKSGKYEYTALTDWTVESVVLAMQGAMKFLGMKYGIVDVEPEVTRNRDRAEELRGSGE